MSRPPAQKGAARPGARPLAWRVHDENPRQSGQFRRHHRVRSDRWPGCGHNPLRDPAQHRAGHHAARRARRQRLFQQGQSRRGANARYRPGDPSQGQREERTCLLRQDTLQGSRPHRTGLRSAQALQTRGSAMRKNRAELPLHRKLRSRPMLDQIRPHGLALQLRFCFDVGSSCRGLMCSPPERPSDDV